jgi:RNA methyltransferase, TrmH family
MCDTNTPSGVVAVVERNAPIPLDRLLSISPFAVAFDAVQDPGNVGTIARTAAAFGVRALIATPGTADPTAPKTLRASAGALIDLPFAEASSLDALCDAAVAAGRPLIVAATRGGASPSSLADLKSGVFLFGNEGAGVRLSAAASARAIEVTIPLEADAESLNVAAAAAVLLDRRRR